MDESNKRGWLIALMVATSLPAIFFAAAPQANDPLSSWELYVSSVFGYLGVTMLLWMYILGNKSVIGLFFRDLAPLLKIHSWLGKYGLVLILLHPLLITLSYGESLLYMFVPHIGTAFERHVTLGRIAFLVLIVIWITSALLRGKIKYRPWKYIHFLTYIALPFSLLHIPLIGTQLLAHPALKIYYFALVVAYTIFTFIRLSSLFNLDKARYRIERSEPIGDSTFLITLQPTQEHIRPPQPGQYIYVKLGFVSEDHPFSVVSYDESSGSITLAYRTYGQFTTLLSKMKPGTEVFVGGSFGSFTHEFSGSSSPAVFIAGGIGITPFMSHLLGGNAARSQLVYANRSQSSSLFLEPLRQRLGSRMVELYSNEAGIVPRYVDESALSQLSTDPQRAMFYLCGPAGMIKSARKALLNLGVPKRHIIAEEFMF